MSKVIEGFDLYSGFARLGSDAPSIAVITCKAPGLEHEFFQIGEHSSDEAASRAAAEYLANLSAIPDSWLTRLHSNPKTS